MRSLAVVVVVATEVPPAVELPELVLALAAAALSVLISFKRLVTWAWRARKSASEGGLEPLMSLV
jgi:hypothetical protein